MRNILRAANGEILAFTRSEGPNSTHQVGKIFMNNNINTLSDCNEGGTAGTPKSATSLV